MKTGKIIAAILGLFIVLPIWFYLLYKILEAIHASELMWFLYWMYAPIAIITNIIIKLSEEK